MASFTASLPSNAKVSLSLSLLQMVGGEGEEDMKEATGRRTGAVFESAY